MENSTLNRTRLFTPPAWFNHFALIFSLLLTVICLLGIFGNALSIVVFLQSRLRHLSINILLTALSITDFCLVTIGVPVFISGPIIRTHRQSMPLEKLYAFSIVYLYPVTLIFHCCSIWLLVAITIERYIAVCKPLLVATYCKRTRALCVIAIIVNISILCNLVRFWEFGFSNSWVPVVFLRHNYYYKLWYLNVGNLLFVYFFPLVIMIYLNCRVAKELKNWRARRKKHKSSMQLYDHQTARMLFYVVVCFILCYAPCFILNTVEAIYPKLFMVEIGYILSDINNATVLFNAATSFLFYYKFSIRYRRTTKLVLARIFRPEVYERMILRDEDSHKLFSIVHTSPSIVSSRYGVHFNASRSKERNWRKTAFRALTPDMRRTSVPALVVENGLIAIERERLKSVRRRSDCTPNILSYETFEQEQTVETTTKLGTNISTMSWQI